MSTPAAVIGGVANIFVPDDGEQIDLGYTAIRVYWATSETASASLATTLTLVDGQRDYSYNKTDALSTDWFEWAFYGATPGEGPRSERVRIGPPQSTRLLIRQGVGRRLRLMDGPYAITTATDSDTCVISALIDPDASAWRFANRFLRCSAGTASGQTRRVRNVANTGYVPSTGTLNVNRATSPAWLADDSLEIWRAKSDEDPSVLIDEAMNRAASNLWWEDTFYFSADADISEYFMPATMLPGSIIRAELASDTYPTRPGWVDVGFHDLTMEGGSPMLSLRRSTMGGAYLDSGDIVRLRYSRHGDAMDSDTDYWSVDLQWAIAEAAYEFLNTLMTPSGAQEAIQDATKAMAAVQRDVQKYRNIYLPQPKILVQAPR